MQERSLKDLLKFVVPYKKIVLAALLSLIFTASITLFIGQGLRLLVDKGFVGSSLEFLNKTVLVFVSLVFLLAIGTFFRYFLVSWLGERVSSDLRIAVYNNLIKLHPGFFEENHSNEIQSRITADTVVLQTLIGSSVSIALRNAIMCSGGIIWLFITNVKLTSIVIACIPIVLIPILFFGRKVKKLSRITQDSLAEVGSHVSEALQNIKLVHAYNYENKSQDIFKKRVENNFKISILRIKQRAFLIVAVITLVLGAIAVVLWLGGLDVLNGKISPGELTAFIFYSIIVAGAIGAISEIWSDIQRAKGAASRLLELMYAKNQITTIENFTKITQPKGIIEFKNVSFYYATRPEVKVLDNISFKVKKGNHIAIVGTSGAGKSTIFDLFLRFYDPVSGDIYFDNVDIKLLNLQELRKQIAVVPQNPVLFTGTILDNIAYGMDLSFNDIKNAAKMSYIHNFIKELPNGYNTFIGELGSRLSGGQRQRIAIARAIVRQAKILLLDEATSALDSENSYYIQNSLQNCFQGLTTVVITHRISTVKFADKIIILENGKILDKGSHEELLSNSKLYAKLCNSKLE